MIATIILAVLIFSGFGMLFTRALSSVVRLPAAMTVMMSVVR